MLLGFAAFQPDTLRLSRSATIAAPPDKVFALINDLRSFNDWNPFVRLQPHNAITDDTVQTPGEKSSTVAGTMHGRTPRRGETGNPSFPFAEATPCEVIGRVASQRADENASKALGRRTK